MLQIDTTTQRGAARVSIRGQLDLTAASAFDEALTEAAGAAERIEIDLGRVDFIDGSGLSMLMDAERRARHARRQLTIVAVSRCVRRLIGITETAVRVSPLPPDPDLGAGEDEH
jgi:anti-anti-sigma factor